MTQSTFNTIYTRPPAHIPAPEPEAIPMDRPDGLRFTIDSSLAPAAILDAATGERYPASPAGLERLAGLLNAAYAVMAQFAPWGVSGRSTPDRGQEGGGCDGGAEKGLAARMGGELENGGGN